MLPLVARAARALTLWLAPAYGGELRLEPDLDAVEALSPEREALWARLDAASFLTDDEKRAAAGYGPNNEEVADDSTGPFAHKYNPNQSRVPAGNPDGGQWTDGGGGGDDGDDPFRDLPNSPNTADGDDRNPLLHLIGGRTGYPIDLLEEEESGGHTRKEHIGKSEQYLQGKLLESRYNIGGRIFYGRKRYGSFPSLEAANKLVNSTISQNLAAKIEPFVRGDFLFSLPVLYVFGDFTSPTGYEAHAPNNRSQPAIRPTYSVTVRLVRSATHPRGYYVNSAWPSNSD